jgi:hypothetical protein
MGPVPTHLVSRRAVVATTVGGGVLLASGLGFSLLTTACAWSAEAGRDPFEDLGRSLAEGPDGDRLAAAAPPGLHDTLRDVPSLLARVDDLAEDISEDFRQGRTVLGDGWLLAETEAVLLVAYATSEGRGAVR